MSETLPRGLRDATAVAAASVHCQRALDDLAARLAEADAEAKRRALDRTLSCAVRDLKIVFAGELKDGELINIRQTDSAKAQVRMAMNSDDLVRLVAGELHLGSAWATGRIRVDASVRDLLRLGPDGAAIRTYPTVRAAIAAIGAGEAPPPEG